MEFSKLTWLRLSWLGLGLASTGYGCSSSTQSSASSILGGSSNAGAPGGGSTSTAAGQGGQSVLGSAAGAGGPSANAGNSAVGGRANTGGTATTGGSGANVGGSSSGGAATGGSITTAGASNTGGSKLTGGSSAAGGVTTTGGAVATGGSKQTGGHSATGGSTPVGGSLATGGSKPTGGSSATGGGNSTPGVRIVGRTTPGTSGTRFEWSGDHIQARFSGTQVSIQLNDGGNKNEFAVVIDGGTPTTLTTASGTTTYSLASGLTDTTHDLVVWRRTEANYNATEFLGLNGFSSGGALLAPPAPPDKRIEIIGDSISCGYGIEGTSSSCSGSQTNENNYLAYGSVAARSLGADVFTEAWSGIGIYRNYNETGPSTNTMPTRYDYSIPTETSRGNWDYTQYQPHVVVINLTSNDFSTKGDPGQPYIDAYVQFLAHLRSVYADAYIICVIEWTSNPSSAGDVNQVVSTVKAGGDTKVESFNISSYANGSGCDGHPNVAGSKAMGDALANEIKRVMGW